MGPFDYSLIDEPDNGSSIKTDNSLMNPVSPKSREVLSKVIADRVSFLKGTIDELNEQMEQRARLAESLKSHIDEDIGRINTELLQMRFIPDPVKRSTLENKIMELLKEKRDNDLSHWHDTTELRRELRKNEKELRTALLDLWMIRFLS